MGSRAAQRSSTRSAEPWPDACMSACHVASARTFGFIVDATATRFAQAIGVPDYFRIQLFHVEDERVLLHPGIVPIAIVGALAANAIEPEVLQGVSTITQQLNDIRQEGRGIRRKRTLLSKRFQAGW